MELTIHIVPKKPAKNEGKASENKKRAHKTRDVYSLQASDFTKFGGSTSETASTSQGATTSEAGTTAGACR